MKEAIVKKDTSVNVIDSPIPKPGPGQVLIKVVVSGTNPKDWKRPSLSGQEANSGDDIAGTVEAVGENVVGFTKGDRVAAFHEMSTPHGSFAEYAVAPYYTTFSIPSSTSYEEAATIPLAAYTAVVALFQELQFPEPWSPLARAAGKEGTKRPLVVYGASTSVGAFAIKLAAAANIHPIVAVGSQRSAFVKPFLDESKGDTLVDYTASKTDEELIGAIQEAVKKGGAPEGTSWKILDAVSEDSTLKLLSKVLTASPKAAASTGSSKPRLTNVLYKSSIKGIDPSVEIFDSKVAQVHAEGEDNKLIGLIWAAAFSRGLREGWLTSHPYTVGKNGLESLSEGLTGLKNGTVRAQKFLVRVGETPGASG